MKVLDKIEELGYTVVLEFDVWDRTTYIVLDDREDVVYSADNILELQCWYMEAVASGTTSI